MYGGNTVYGGASVYGGGQTGMYDAGKTPAYQNDGGQTNYGDQSVWGGGMTPHAHKLDQQLKSDWGQ